MELLGSIQFRRALPASLALFFLGCASLHTTLLVAPETQVHSPSLTLDEGRPGSIQLSATGLGDSSGTVELYRRNQDGDPNSWILRSTIAYHGDQSLTIQDTVDDSPQKMLYVIVTSFPDGEPTRSNLLLISPPKSQPPHTLDAKILASRFVELTWMSHQPELIRVFRRDVLNGEAHPGSFLVEMASENAGQFVDRTVRPGGVYSYSIEALDMRKSQRWSTGFSSEVYVSVPLDAPPQTR
jgi:hypothetical protein